MPPLDALLRATGSGTAQVDGYEMDLERQGQGLPALVLDAHKLDYGNSDGVRLLLSIADVTGARVAEKIKDDLVRETSILLQELQHRVANSLQIIASVLMQSARRVQSDEIRIHLHDAHNRVMSVAALQQQLATSTLGDVELRTYFSDLCRSIGASMIRDHNQLTLDVSVDESIACGPLGQPWAHCHRAGDRRAQACLSRSRLRHDQGWLSLRWSGMDTLGQRQWDRHARTVGGCPFRPS